VFMASLKSVFEQKIKEATPGYEPPLKAPKPVGQREWTPNKTGAHNSNGYVSQVGGEGRGPPPAKKLEDLP